MAEDLTAGTYIHKWNEFTVTVDEIGVVDLSRLVDARVWIDKGAAHFGNFVHHFAFRADGKTGRGTVSVWGLANVVDDTKGWRDNSDEALFARLYWTASAWRIYFWETTTPTQDNYTGLTEDTWYYAIVTRAGTSATMEIYSDEAHTVLVDTLGITIPVDSYRYFFPANSENDGDAAIVSASMKDYSLDGGGTTENLLPHLKLSGTGALLTASSTALDIAGLTEDEDAWVSDDQGAGTIADFEYLFKAYMATTGTGSFAVLVAATNIVSDMRDWLVNDREAVGLRARETSVFNVTLEDFEGNESDTLVGCALNTWYWFTLDRNGATVTGYAYTDEARTDLVGSASVTIDAGRTFRYVNVANSDNNGDNDTTYFQVEDLDLQGGGVIVEASGTIAAVSSLTAAASYATSVTLDFSWTASESADVDHYNLYHSRNAPIDPNNDSPLAQPTGESYQLEITPIQAGTHTFLLRAVDTDGNEEANILQMLKVFVGCDGVLITALPVEPRIVRAEAVADGKVKVSFYYDPTQESGGGGAAYEGRVYWDDGTGTVDWSAPKATASMSSPTRANWWTWTSEALVDEQAYLFGVRIATAASPDGYETDNEDTYNATPDANVPDAPVLAGELI